MLKAIAIGLGLIGCAAEVPNTPDLSELETSYDHPTAVLDPDAADDIRSDVGSLDLLVTGLQVADYIDDAVDEASDAAEGHSAKKLRIRGSVRVAQTCPGVVSDDDLPRGSLSLLFGVADSYVKRGVSGVFSKCVLGASYLDVPVRVDVEGPAEFDLGNDLPIGESFSGRLLMVLAGSVTIGSVVFRNFSARWTSDSFEYLRTLKDGTTVVVELTKDGLFIRDRDEVWVCLDGKPCGPDSPSRSD
jgi:hypothetical protein